ncbi:MAG: GGDEF domain-containing protein [Acidobacteria bacterium]|nr:GGDEF domain-containing protein [Acidobacteriota bacterium]
MPSSSTNSKNRAHETSPSGSTGIPYLLVLSGDVVGRVIRLKPGKRYVCGRSRNLDIFLNDENISREHAFFLTTEAGQTGLTDLSSTNGTLVNGKKIQSIILNDGDRISLGNVILRYSLKDDLEFVFQQELFEKATKDPLTGAYNRAFFMDALQKEFNFHQRTQKPLTLMIFDLDNFKAINDVYGHVNGDIVLKSLAGELINCLRREDLFARFGGEEFVAMFRNTPKEKALRIGEKLLELVRNMNFTLPMVEFKTSVTIGLATLENDNVSTPEELLRMADQNLYAGKKAGKDRVIG